MNFKIIAIFLAILLALGLIGAVVYQITKSTESQKAGTIQNYNNEPHLAPLSFGCVSYRVMADKSDKAK